MKFVFDLLLAKAPWVVRWTFYVSFGLCSLIVTSFVAGVKFIPLVNGHIIEVVNDWAEPRKLARDNQYKDLSVKLDSVAREQNHQGQQIDTLQNFILYGVRPAK